MLPGMRALTTIWGTHGYAGNSRAVRKTSVHGDVIAAHRRRRDALPVHSRNSLKILAESQMCPSRYKRQGIQEIARFRGDRPEQNGDNPVNLCRASWLGELSVIPSRTSVLAIAAIGSLVALAPLRADAQWWHSAPKDFEECADLAEKAKTKQEKTSALAECNAKFAGRRKPAGGYAYYDFMQDRSFDIAGPNPTPEEQRKIDEQYTAYLDKERRSTIAAALAAKPQQPQQQVQQELQQVSLKTETEKVPVPVASPVKQAARIRAANCARNSFSCEWPLLSQSIDELKKLFAPSPSKAKRS
jgi:hypothetical protein